MLEKTLPGTTLKKGTDLPESAGITADTVIMSYDYTLFAHVDVSDEIVAKVVKALYEGKDSLVAAGPIWSDFDPAKLAHITTLEFHPGAIEFYKSAGIWTSD